MTEYIHYGSSELLQMQPIKNQHCWTKPSGGMWASPLKAKFGWKDWCLREQFHTGSLEQYFTFTLKEDAKIIHIYSIKDLKQLPKQKYNDLSEIYEMLDFEVLAKDYDGIELHLSEEKHVSRDISKCLYFRLYGWDCDSILLFNSDCIILDNIHQVGA